MCGEKKTMSRSYRKPIWKTKNVKGMKQLYNRIIRRNNILVKGGNYYKKLNETYEICDWKIYLSKEGIDDWYGDKKYKIYRK